MKMLMLVFLLCVLSKSIVCLQSTAGNSEFAAGVKQEELRSKRQATFFDLLHQAIEKYANCADEHLAPLKSWTGSKQYETLVPEKYSPTKKAVVGASQSNPSKHNVQCTKVNLCTITDGSSFSETADDNNPAILGKALNTDISILVSKLLPNFSTNGNYKVKQSPDVAKSKGIESHRGRHSHHNNFYNHDFLNLFFNKPATRRKQLLRAPEPETVLGRASSKTAASAVTSSCSCLENNRMEVALQNKTTKDAKYLLESDEVVGSVAAEKFSSNWSKESDQTLNQLLMQLDEMAERANNAELKQIIEQLKSLKSAFQTDFENKEDRTYVATPVPLLVAAEVGQQAAKGLANAPRQFSLSNLGVDLLSKLFKTSSGAKAVKGTQGARIEDVANSYDSQFFESHILKDSADLNGGGFHEPVTETNPEGRKLHCSVSAFKSQKLVKSDDFVGITHPSALKLNISNTQNLKPMTDDLCNSVSNMESRKLSNSYGFSRPQSPETSTDNTLGSAFKTGNVEDYYEESSLETITEPSTISCNISNKQNERNAFVSSKNTYPKQAKQNHAQRPAATKKYKNTQNPISESPTNSSKVGKKNSKITISITSNGNFKNIHVEQHVPDDTNLEISEKEKMNMATRSSNGRSEDMLGTGSRFVKLVKLPQKIDSYAEPILSEMYPAETKPSTKPPPSIYWHKIEKQSSKLNGATRGAWQTFQSGDVLESGNCYDEGAGANSKRGIKYRDTPDPKESNKQLT